MNHEKLANVLQRYLGLLELRNKRLKNKKTPNGYQSFCGNKQARRGYNTKKRIIDFFVKNGEWPSLKSPYFLDRKLGRSFENFTCPTSGSYDPVLRKIALATGRKASGKRKHNVDFFKEEILEFVQTHNRVPVSTNSTEIVPGESKLRQKLDYYTQLRNDTSLMGKVYAIDKCHRSGIPNRFRPLINNALDVEKPLIRLVKQQTKEQVNE